MGALDESKITVVLPAQFSGAAVKETVNSVREKISQGVKILRLDFSATKFIDSSGIGSLASLARYFKEQKVSLMLYNLDGEIKELFMDTGLDRIFTIETGDGIHKADIDIFEQSVDIKLVMRQEDRGDVAILHLSGIMNHPTGSRFFKQQFLLCLAHFHKVLLDLDDLTFFDSMSISVVLNMNKLLYKTGGAMRICGANYIVDDLFTTLNIQSIIPFFNKVDDAFVDWQ